MNYDLFLFFIFGPINVSPSRIGVFVSLSAFCMSVAGWMQPIIFLLIKFHEEKETLVDDDAHSIVNFLLQVNYCSTTSHKFIDSLLGFRTFSDMTPR